MFWLRMEGKYSAHIFNTASQPTEYQYGILHHCQLYIYVCGWGTYTVQGGGVHLGKGGRSIGEEVAKNESSFIKYAYISG